MKNLAWLEAQMDRDDLTDEEFDTYNRQLNEIYEAQDKIRNAAKAKREQELRELREEQEIAWAEAITEEQVEKMYEDSCVKYQDVNGMAFKDWYAQSLKYYTIDANHTVHAKARSSNTVELIQHVSVAHAKLTILTRIKYKFYDHAVRGRDFAYEIE